MKNGKITLGVVEEKGELLVIPPSQYSYGELNEDYKPPTDSKPKETLGSYEEHRMTGDLWAPWGDTDEDPNILRNKIKSSPIAGQAIFRMVQMMFGNGVCYYNNKDFQRTGEMKRIVNPKIERFIRMNRIHTFFLPAMFTDWRQFFNAFCEVIFSLDRKQITKIYHKNALFCRLEVQNQKNYKIEHLYYSPTFVDSYPQNDEISKIPLFDWTEQEDFLKKLPGYKFAWHCAWPGGDPYYAEPFHIGLAKDNGWLDVNNKVPRIVNAMMDNQIALKYLIHIPESFYLIRFPEYAHADGEKKTKIITDHIKKIDEQLKGVDKTYSSVVSIFKDDTLGAGSNSAVGKIEIESVDDKLKKDSWVPSADHSNAQIVQALGLHPSQMGLAPEGGKMGAGSGSDQRESYNTGIQLNTIEQEILLEPLNWIATYNAQTDPDWNVTFYIDHTMHTTTNNVETGLLPGENAPGQNQIQQS